MKALWVIVGHAVVVGLLLWAGFAFNDIITKYSDAYTGIITLFSVAFAAYTTALNFLYQRNAAFHLFVHRLLLRVTRTHTFWQPQFDFQLDQERASDPLLLTQVRKCFARDDMGRPSRRTRHRRRFR